jgi:F0F1-type ATP synthase epsilon subunit
MADPLRVVIRTPHEVAVDVPARSLRVVTDSGQVGLRRGMEPVVLAVEAGLVLVRTDEGERFVGAAGGLLSCDGKQATLYTPLAVTGEDPAAIEAAVNRALGEPGSELSLRAAFDRLEERILTELRHRSTPASTARGDER